MSEDISRIVLEFSLDNNKPLPKTRTKDGIKYYLGEVVGMQKIDSKTLYHMTIKKYQKVKTK